MSAETSLPFGVLLKRLRRAAGPSREGLAERAGNSAVYLSMLERGAQTPAPSAATLLSVGMIRPRSLSSPCMVRSTAGGRSMTSGSSPYGRSHSIESTAL